MPNLKIAISPCPNDTFVFENFIFSYNLDYKLSVEFHDIQVLNELSLLNKYDLIKVSFAMLPKLLDNYSLLSVGSALGKGNGPLLVSNKKIDIEDIYNQRVLCPGINTTANFLFDYFFNNCKNKSHTIFSEIETNILNNNADIGLIIHENRFTYEKKGLKKIADLGEMWEQATQLPIPLGCLLINKNISLNNQIDIQKNLQKSILEGKKNLPKISQFIKANAQEIDDLVILNHINLYVNNYTYELDNNAIIAIQTLINKVFPNFIYPKNWLIQN